MLCRDDSLYEGMLIKTHHYLIHINNTVLYYRKKKNNKAFGIGATRLAYHIVIANFKLENRDLYTMQT